MVELGKKYENPYKIRNEVRKRVLGSKEVFKPIVYLACLPVSGGLELWEFFCAGSEIPAYSQDPGASMIGFAEADKNWSLRQIAKNRSMNYIF